MRLFYMFIFRTLFITLSVLTSLSGKAQVLPSSADISYLYSFSSPLHIRHQLVSSANKNWIILEVDATKDFLDSLSFSFSLTPNLDKPLTSFQKLEVNKLKISESKDRQLFAIDVSGVDSRYVVFRMYQSSNNKTFTYIVELVNPANLIFTTSQLTIPDLNGFTHLNSPLKVSTLNGSNQNYGVKFFGKPFRLPPPPMGDLKFDSPFNEADTVFSITSGSTLPTNEIGTYALFSEDNEEHSSFFRVENPSFPKIATLDDLVQTSVYLWTREEQKKLLDSDDPKKTFDRFWLNNTNSPQRAGKTISAYFNRVKEANERFTSFKEGWKTDMGMIYIIFGAPDKAFKTNDGIQWVYKKTYELPSFIFTFYPNDKFFTSEYYELERDIQYQNIWFRAVELWRKGRKSL